MNSSPETATPALYMAVAEILQIESAGPQDNFIELGGNSLLAVILANRMEDELGMRLDVMDIFSLDLNQLEAILVAGPSQADGGGAP